MDLSNSVTFSAVRARSCATTWDTVGELTDNEAENVIQIEERKLCRHNQTFWLLSTTLSLSLRCAPIWDQAWTAARCQQALVAGGRCAERRWKQTPSPMDWDLVKKKKKRPAASHMRRQAAAVIYANGMARKHDFLCTGSARTRQRRCFTCCTGSRFFLASCRPGRGWWSAIKISVSLQSRRWWSIQGKFVKNWTQRMFQQNIS